MSNVGTQPGEAVERLKLLFASCVVLAASACGGGGGDNPPTASPPPPSSSPAPAPVPPPPPPPPPAPPLPPPPPPPYLPAPTASTSSTVLWQRYHTDTPEFASHVQMYVFEQLQSVETFANDGTPPLLNINSYTYFDFGDTPVGPQALLIGAPYENIPLVSNSEYRAPPPRLRPGQYQPAYGRGNGWRVPAAQLTTTRCTVADGALVVHEVEYDAQGDMTRLAADYSVNCGHNRVGSNGAIRHNSTVPLALDALYVVPWRDHDVVEGRPIMIDGSFSWSPTSRVSSLTWRQVSGPAFDLSNCSAAGVCRTFVPLVPRGGAAAVFELTATTESGRTATGTLRLGLRSLHDRQTLIEAWGHPQDVALTDRDGAFGLPVRHGGQALYLAQRPDRFALGFDPSNVNGIGMDWIMGVSLSNTDGVPLVPGTYSGTESDALGIPGSEPAASYSGAPSSCVHPTWTAVLAELRRDPADLTALQGLGYWFTLECPDGDAVHAHFRLDNELVSPPTAVASGPSTVSRGTPSVFTDGGSTAPQGGVALQSWQQVFGPAVESFDVSTNGSARIVPAPETPDGTRLVFAYRVFDQWRQSSVTLLSVTVQGGPIAADRAALSSLAPTASRPATRPYGVRWSQAPAIAARSRPAPAP